MILETTIGVRELKAQLSTYLAQVKAGATVTITEHGKPIGRIVPLSKTKEERLQAMIDAGFIKWGGGKLKPLDEAQLITPEPGATKLLSQIVVENRE